MSGLFWWDEVPENGPWDITWAGSFYRANSTATLLWLFTHWNHSFLLALVCLSFFGIVLVACGVVVGTIICLVRILVLCASEWLEEYRALARVPTPAPPTFAQITRQSTWNGARPPPVTPNSRCIITPEGSITPGFSPQRLTQPVPRSLCNAPGSPTPQPPSEIIETSCTTRRLVRRRSNSIPSAGGRWTRRPSTTSHLG